MRYVRMGQVQTRFLDLRPVASSNAQGIIDAIHDAMQELEIPEAEWKPKLLSLGTDGASVNTGVRNGVVALMRQADMPWLMGMWCCAHKLELSMLDSIKEEKKLADIKELQQGIYKQV